MSGRTKLERSLDDANAEVDRLRREHDGSGRAQRDLAVAVVNRGELRRKLRHHRLKMEGR